MREYGRRLWKDAHERGLVYARRVLEAKSEEVGCLEFTREVDHEQTMVGHMRRLASDLPKNCSPNQLHCCLPYNSECVREDLLLIIDKVYASNYTKLLKENAS